jgi:hypothetical protein
MFYYLLKTLMVILYIATAVWSIQFNLGPIIAQHGVWTFLMMNLTFFVLCFTATFAFLIIPKPRKPQATSRPFTSGDIS